ncbi:hypothetical protein DFH28DRAFT_962765 [Melampsora americana]|nr:hypothetical protein DFH28DRAFT_962765 [Melampsora americana]
MTAISTLPSGPLRLATSSKPINTFSLKYPASHPSDLSTAGAALSSTASGDISLRIAPGTHSGEVRGRRWAGRQSRATGDVECAIVWDATQNCWILHRVDNVVQLASDDPQPLPRKPTASVSQPPKPAALALPKPARLPPPPPVSSQAQREPAGVNQPIMIPSSSVPSSSKPDSKSSQPTPPNHQREHSGRSIATDPSISRQSSLDSSSSKSALDHNTGLALSTKGSAPPLPHLPQTTAHRISTTSTISSPGDQGPIRVVQAEEIEEFDFADSSPDRAPHPPIIAPSPLMLPSPGVGQISRSGHSHTTTNCSPAGRPNLSRSPSLAETGTVCSPVTRPNASQGLALPTRSAAHPPTAPSPAYPHNGIAPRSSAAVSHNQPTAPSPLQSMAYSSSSSPTDPAQAAPTPPVVGISPASVTTGPSAPLRAPASRAPPGQSPAWQQYNHHLQHPSNPASPHHLTNRSPAPLTNQNLSQQSSSVPTRTYHRSDSGSSVRESDTDSSDEESSEEEEEAEVKAVGSVSVPTITTTLSTGGIANSEDDAEGDEDDEEDDAEFENMATELEASMLIRDYYGPGAEEPKGVEEVVPNPLTPKAKPKKKGGGPANKSGGSHRKTGGGGGGKTGGGKGKSKEKVKAAS